MHLMVSSTNERRLIMRMNDGVLRSFLERIMSYLSAFVVPSFCFDIRWFGSLAGSQAWGCGGLFLLFSFASLWWGVCFFMGGG